MSGCEGCPPMTPCPPLDGFGSWSETDHFFTIGFGFTAQGTESGSAAPGLMDVLYHVDHLLGSASLPSPLRSEEVGYAFALSGVGAFDPDEFQIRGRLQERFDWTIPSLPTAAASQVRQTALLRLQLLDAGSSLLGLELARERAADTSTGASWDQMTETFVARIIYTGGPGGDDTATVPTLLETSNFVLDRSIARGTTQLWLDGSLLIDAVTTIPRVGGSLTFEIDRARCGVFTTSIPDLPMAEMELELSGIRVCPPGTVIAERRPVRNQLVHNEFVGIGDASTTGYTTDFPYLPNTLNVYVAGILSDADSVDPAVGTFALPAPPHVGAWITTSYRAAGD